MEKFKYNYSCIARLYTHSSNSTEITLWRRIIPKKVLSWHALHEQRFSLTSTNISSTKSMIT